MASMDVLVFVPVLILSIISYSPSIMGGFVFDDSEAILTNNDLNPDHTSLSDLLNHDFWGNSITSNTSHKSYRPLTVLSFRLDFIIARGHNPMIFHLMNIFLHSIASVLFCMVVNQLQHNLSVHVSNGNTWLFPCIAGALFASHPIHTECVAGIVGRAELWSAIWFFLSFLFYQKLHRLAKLSASMSVVSSVLLGLLGCVAMLFKEQGITVLGVCFMYELVQWNNDNDKRFMMLRVGVISVCGTSLMCLRLWVMNFESPSFQQMDNPAAFENNTFTKIMTFSYIYSLNTWLLLAPYWLCFDWSIGCIPLINALTDPRVGVVALFWCSSLLFGIAIISVIKSRKLTIMCGSLIILPFLPSSNIFFTVGFVIAERALYLPSAGHCILVGFGFSRLYQQYKKLTLVMVSWLIMIFVIRSLDRSIDWTTEEKLFTSGLRVCNSNAKVHYNIGKLSADKGDVTGAEEYYREAIRLFPEYDQALNNLGNLLKANGRPLEGEPLLMKAITVNPKFAAAWMNLGTIKMALNKHSEAESCYLKSISLREGYSDAYYNLGLTYIETGQFAKAADALRSAINYKQNHIEAWNNLGLLYLNTNDLQSAEAILRLSVSLFPETSRFHSMLGVLLGKKGLYNEGRDKLLTAIQLDPSNAKYQANLGVIYHLAKEYGKAKEHYERALEIDPTLNDTNQNLMKLKLKT